MKKYFKRKYIVIFTILLSIFLYWQNNHITISEYTYSNTLIPSDFNNLKILHISDLHNKSFGSNQSYLTSEIENINPDIIFITGDIIDQRKYNLEPAITLIENIKSIAPIYYVSGNHEAWSNNYPEIKQELINNNVTVLDNESTFINKNNSSIEILGVIDPDFINSSKETINSYLSNFNNDGANNSFKILLSHRPELMDIYVENNINLIFSGHVHGGQIRLPFIGGLVGPNQGLLPKYDAGEYVEQNSTMYLSRGLGNSIFPFRVFNRPHLIVVTLKSN